MILSKFWRIGQMLSCDLFCELATRAALEQVISGSSDIQVLELSYAAFLAWTT